MLYFSGLKELFDVSEWTARNGVETRKSIDGSTENSLVYFTRQYQL